VTVRRQAADARRSHLAATEPSETGIARRVPVEPHAAARWARAVLPIIDSPTDPRTIELWGKIIHASVGAIRNWCFAAGIGPRRSLVFGRLLRAVALSERGQHKPENLLDVVDRRTIASLLRFAGLTARQFPRDVAEFLDVQILVRDRDALLQVKDALEQRRLF
jgi:hypothetical protein